MKWRRLSDMWPVSTLNIRYFDSVMDGYSWGQREYFISPFFHLPVMMCSTRRQEEECVYLLFIVSSSLTVQRCFFVRLWGRGQMKRIILSNSIKLLIKQILVVKKDQLGWIFTNRFILQPHLEYLDAGFVIESPTVAIWQHHIWTPSAMC